MVNVKNEDELIKMIVEGSSQISIVKKIEITSPIFCTSDVKIDLCGNTLIFNCPLVLNSTMCVSGGNIVLEKCFSIFSDGGKFVTNSRKYIIESNIDCNYWEISFSGNVEIILNSLLIYYGDIDTRKCDLKVSGKGILKVKGDVLRESGSLSCDGIGLELNKTLKLSKKDSIKNCIIVNDMSSDCDNAIDFNNIETDFSNNEIRILKNVNSVFSSIGDTINIVKTKVAFGGSASANYGLVVSSGKDVNLTGTDLGNSYVKQYVVWKGINEACDFKSEKYIAVGHYPGDFDTVIIRGKDDKIYKMLKIMFGKYITESKSFFINIIAKENNYFKTEDIQTIISSGKKGNNISFASMMMVSQGDFTQERTTIGCGYFGKIGNSLNDIFEFKQSMSSPKFRKFPVGDQEICEKFVGDTKLSYKFSQSDEEFILPIDIDFVVKDKLIDQDISINPSNVDMSLIGKKYFPISFSFKYPCLFPFVVNVSGDDMVKISKDKKKKEKVFSIGETSNIYVQKRKRTLNTVSGDSKVMFKIEKWSTNPMVLKINNKEEKGIFFSYEKDGNFVSKLGKISSSEVSTIKVDNDFNKSRMFINKKIFIKGEGDVKFEIEPLGDYKFDIKYNVDSMENCRCAKLEIEFLGDDGKTAMESKYECKKFSIKLIINSEETSICGEMMPPNNIYVKVKERVYDLNEVITTSEKNIEYLVPFLSSGIKIPLEKTRYLDSEVENESVYIESGSNSSKITLEEKKTEFVLGKREYTIKPLMSGYNFSVLNFVVEETNKRGIVLSILNEEVMKVIDMDCNLLSNSDSVVVKLNTDVVAKEEKIKINIETLSALREDLRLNIIATGNASLSTKDGESSPVLQISIPKDRKVSEFWISTANSYADVKLYIYSSPSGIDYNSMFIFPCYIVMNTGKSLSEKVESGSWELSKYSNGDIVLKTL